MILSTSKLTYNEGGLELSFRIHMAVAECFEVLSLAKATLVFVSINFCWQIWPTPWMFTI